MQVIRRKVTDMFINYAKATSFEDRISMSVMEDSCFGNYNLTQDRNLLAVTSLPFSFKKLCVNYGNTLYNFSDCVECKNTTHVKNYPTGNLNPEYFVIGIAPGFANTKSFGNDRVMSYGKTADYLRRALIKLDIHWYAWYTNIIKCSVCGNRDVTQAEASNCIAFFINEIVTFKPSKAIVLGVEAAEWFKKYYAKYFKEIYYCKHPSSFVRNDSAENYYKHMKGILVK